jgi:alpha-1,2-mannosyltransferase
MKKTIELVLIILCLASFLNMAKVITYGYWPDFSFFYNNGYAVVHHTDPYQLIQADGTYIYPPISLLLFTALTPLPVMIAGVVWAAFSIILLLASVWLLLKQYHATKNRIILLVTGILVFNFFPVKFTLGMGQINNVMLFLIVLAMYAGNKGKDGLAGAFYGTSIALKYMPLFILPYLFIRKKWRTLLGVCITILGLFFAGFIILMPAASSYFFTHVLFHTALFSSWYVYYNQALSGFLLRDFPMYSAQQLAFVRIGISLLFLLITGYVVVKRKLQKKDNPDLEISVFIILNLLLNTFSDQHHFVLFLIPLLVTFFVLKQNKFTWQYYLIPAIAYLLVATNMKNPAAFPVLLQSHVFYGALLLWIFDLYLLNKPTLQLPHSI